MPNKIPSKQNQFIPLHTYNQEPWFCHKTNNPSQIIKTGQ